MRSLTCNLQTIYSSGRTFLKGFVFILLFALTSELEAQSLSFIQFDDEEMSLVQSDTNSDSSPFLTGIDSLSKRKLNRYLKTGGNVEKLIKHANGLYDKMWYAEAAKYYDKALENANAAHTFEVLSKAGDSHYYSGNMEKAYKWYHRLYENFGSDITDNLFFKYAHSLKGTGRYRRAAKLTQLFAQKSNRPIPKVSDFGVVAKKDTGIEIKNVSINTKYSDFAPMFHNGGDVVFSSAHDSSFLTTRRYKWNNQPFLDLYMAKVDEENKDLIGTKKFSSVLNTKYHEASVAFTPDQKTVYFTRNNYGKKLRRSKKGINHLKIYRSSLTNGEWSEAVEVSFNSEDYSTGHPSVSPDGKKLYFVSDRPGGFGSTDVYMVDILEDGSYSEPKNLGRAINTEKKEMFPFITENALYFSSDRTMGFGGLDVYKANQVEGIFGVATNLGEPINSSRDDFSYIIDKENKKGYFASNRKGGKGDDDIYSFEHIENLNAVFGKILDGASQEPLPEAIVALYDKDNMRIAEAKTGLDGSFAFEDLAPKSKYTIKTGKKGYFDDDLVVETKNNQRIDVEQNLVPVKEIIAEEKGVLKIETESIYFDFDRFNIKRQAAEELDKLVAVMTEYPEMVIKIESHTDAIGKKAYNRYLSDKRAKSTRDYIISKGVDASRIQSAIGYGEEHLLNNCADGKRCSRELHRQNRRSEFIIVKM